MSDRSRNSRGAVGRFFCSPHAVRRFAQYLGNRTLTYDQILGRLIRLADRAHFVKRLPTGGELWRTGKPERLRLIVGPGSGPLPVVITVLARSDRDV